MELINIPRVLREKLGEDGADSLVELLNRVSNHTRDDVLTFVEEKFEHRLSEEVAKVNQRITDEIAMVRGEIQVLRTDMHAMRADLIKWMFIFWAGQIGVILGILFAFFR